MACLAFDSTISQLQRHVFWDVTYGDVKTKIKLYLGEKQALIVQDFQTLVEVMSLAFGDGGSKSKQRDLSDIPVPKNAQELAQMCSRVFM